MKPETARWLQGQIRAVDMLAELIRKTLLTHGENMAAECMDSVWFACNQAHRAIDPLTPERA